MVQIIIVLYKTLLENSRTYQSFEKNKKEISFPYSLLIYNNSPEFPVPYSSAYEVRNASQNDMLSIAYNYALGKANAKKMDWLLLLDQDTLLTADYFKGVARTLSSDMAVDDNVACIIPQIYSLNGIQISPWAYNPFWGAYGLVKRAKIGVSAKPIAAFNSGALVRVESINKIGGFPENYPLDNLDTCYLYRLWKNGMMVYVFKSSVVQELSQLNYADNMTPWRYQMILESTKRIAKEQGWIPQVVLFARLCVRSLKQLFDSEKRKYVLLTLRGLIR